MSWSERSCPDRGGRGGVLHARGRRGGGLQGRLKVSLEIGHFDEPGPENPRMYKAYRNPGMDRLPTIFSLYLGSKEIEV